MPRASSINIRNKLSKACLLLHVTWNICNTRPRGSCSDFLLHPKCSCLGGYLVSAAFITLVHMSNGGKCTSRGAVKTATNWLVFFWEIWVSGHIWSILSSYPDIWLLCGSVQCVRMHKYTMQRTSSTVEPFNNVEINHPRRSCWSSLSTTCLD